MMLKIYEDLSKESQEAIKYLRSEGFGVFSIPVDGKFGPELRMGPFESYYGLKQIKEFLKRYRLEKSNGRCR